MKANIISIPGVRIPRKKIERLLALIVRGEKPAVKTVNLILVNDPVMAKLNRIYRKKSGPTDVLSFNIDSKPGPDAILGEIYISLPTATRQAGEYGTSLPAELLRLVCHGALHLVGYDHIKPAPRAMMEAREELYLRRMESR